MKDSLVQMSVNKQLVTLRGETPWFVWYSTWTLSRKTTLARLWTYRAYKKYYILLSFVLSFCTLQEIKMITIIFSTFYADLSVLIIYSE